MIAENFFPGGGNETFFDTVPHEYVDMKSSL
jgi:hypothetical protein